MTLTIPAPNVAIAAANPVSSFFPVPTTIARNKIWNTIWTMIPVVIEAIHRKYRGMRQMVVAAAAACEPADAVWPGSAGS